MTIDQTYLRKKRVFTVEHGPAAQSGGHKHPSFGDLQHVPTRYDTENKCYKVIHTR